jgi:hypothetical protein
MAVCKSETQGKDSNKYSRFMLNGMTIFWGITIPGTPISFIPCGRQRAQTLTSLFLLMGLSRTERGAYCTPSYRKASDPRRGPEAQHLN